MGAKKDTKNKKKDNAQQNKKSRHEEFGELSFEEQCKVVYQSPLAQKPDLVVRSQDPTRLVRSFSAEELYLMTREMSGSNVPELIQHADIDQIQFMADFECWEDGYISKKGFIQWLEYLEEAGDDKLASWLLNTDFEVIIAGFQKYITVLKPYHEERVDDILADNAYFTIDGFYYILIDEDNMDIIKRAVTVLFDEAKHFYYNLLEGVMAETEDVIEEEAFTHRGVRMSEKGFPAKEQALRIYRPLDREEWERNAKRDIGIAAGEVPQGPPPMYPTIWDAERIFLDDVMATLAQQPREVQLAIYQEMVWLTNKILVCRGMESFCEKTVQKAFLEARYTLSIALEALSEGDVQVAHDVLVTCWIEYIFRWGYSQVVKLRDEAGRIIKAYWDYSTERLCRFLGDSFGRFLRAIMATQPQLFDPAVHDSLEQVRCFKSVAELHAAYAKVACIEMLQKLLTSRICTGWEKYLDEFATSAEQEYDEVTVLSIMLTLFARFVLDASLSVQVLSGTEVQCFLAEAFLGTTDAAELRQIDPALQASFVAAVSDQNNVLKPDEFQLLNIFFTELFRKGEEEMGLIDPAEPIEPQFMSYLLTKK